MSAISAPVSSRFTLPGLPTTSDLGGTFMPSTNRVPADVLGPRIDVAALGLFQRGYCGREMDNPDEARFIQRLHDADSEEHRVLTSIVDFTRRYPQTF